MECFIVLPKDEATVEKLKKKLAEYEGRLTHPDWQTNHLISDTVCKIAVLKHLLSNGRVSDNDFPKVVADIAAMRYRGLDITLLSQAFGVIKDYCETGGKNVFGGTKLK